MLKKDLKQLLKEYIRQLLREADGDIPPQQPPNNNSNPSEQKPPEQPQQPEPEQKPQPNVFYATTEQMADLIRQTKGKIFTCAFIKRSTKQERVMNARLGVRAYLHGGVLPYNPNQKNLIPCFDIQKKAYRMISIEGITSLKISGNIYVLPGTTF